MRDLALHQVPAISVAVHLHPCVTSQTHLSFSSYVNNNIGKKYLEMPNGKRNLEQNVEVRALVFLFKKIALKINLQVSKLLN